MVIVGVENRFDFLSAEYAELFSRSDATVFQHPLWLDRVYSRLAPSRSAQPLVITARARNNELLMVLPLLRRRQGGIRLIEFADLGVSDYITPICSAAALAQVSGDEAARKAIRAALLPYDVLRLPKLKDSSKGFEPLFGAKPRALMPMSAYPVPLPHSFEAWRNGYLDRSYGKELDKKARQLHRKGKVRFECCDDPELIKLAFAAMREFRGLRFAASDLLQATAYFDFYLDIAIAGRARGLARTYLMTIDDVPIAGVLGLAHRHELSVVLGGFDQVRFRKQSIGSLAFQEVARDAIGRGDVCLDFTIGDEPYKRLFGAQPASMWTIEATGSPIGRATAFLVKQLPWLKTVSKRLQRPLAASSH